MESDGETTNKPNSRTYTIRLIIDFSTCAPQTRLSEEFPLGREIFFCIFQIVWQMRISYETTEKARVVRKMIF